MPGDSTGRIWSELTEPSPVAGVHFPEFDHPYAGRYGLFDAAAAAERGYAPPPQLPVPPRDASTGRSTTEEENFILIGRRAPGFEKAPLPVDSNGKPLPPDGCRGEAERRLAAGISRPPDLDLVPTLYTESYQRIEQDSRVVAAVSAWSSCMAAKGYDYASHWDANSDHWSLRPKSEEISTALADVACKQETNLVGICFAVESAYQQRLIDHFAEALESIKRYLETVNRTAAEIVGGG